MRKKLPKMDIEVDLSRNQSLRRQTSRSLLNTQTNADFLRMQGNKLTIAMWLSETPKGGTAHPAAAAQMRAQQARSRARCCFRNTEKPKLKCGSFGCCWGQAEVTR
jgi:hypothetical protein